jgi:HEAT repeat protein
MTKPTAKKASAMTSVRQQLQRILKRLEGRSEATPEESLQQILALPAKQVIPMLIEALEKSPHYLVRLVSAMALGELRAEKAVPVLISTLSDSSLTVQRAAAEALAKIGRPAVSSLLEFINHEELAMRRWVIQILGKIGAKEAAPALLERFTKEAPELQRLIVEALGEIGSRKAFKLLTELVRHGGADFSRTAIEALGKLKDPKAIPFLLDILARDGAELRRLVRDALMSIGKESVPHLVKALKHPNQTVLDKLLRKSSVQWETEGL